MDVNHALGIEIERPAAGQAVVVFGGDHDLVQADALRERLSQLVAENEVVVADLSHAQFVDSTIVNVLLHTKREACERLHRFRIQLDGDCTVYRVFELAGVLSVLECASTRADALAGSPAAGVLVPGV